MTPAPFNVIGQRPGAAASDIIAALFDYREPVAAGNFQRKAAPLSVSLIFSLGTPFSVRPAGGAAPAVATPACFASGPRPEATDIASQGGACVVQVDLTPLGGYRLLGPAMAALAEPVCTLDALLGPSVEALWEQLQAAQDAPARLALAERFVLQHSRHAPSNAVTHACRQLARDPGAPTIASLAQEAGWSHKHFIQRFRAETGTTPKAFARMLRFHRACALARRAAAPHWAQVAAAAGYSDQAHMNRDFLALAGEPPRQWLQRAATSPQALAW